MRRRRLILLIASLPVMAIAAPPAQRGGVTPAPDPVEERIRAGAAKLYDTSVLHVIDIVIPLEDTAKIVRRTEERIRCTFTFDGRTLTNVGVRQAGGIFHGYVPIEGKPSLSLKFDEFVKGQRLFDLDKLILKNELQDLGLVNEHLTYEVFRRAGLAASLTAHARVTINGIDAGIYLLREPIDKDFLVRNFGKGHETGNLYEIENLQEFVFQPTAPKLDDEGKNGRTRDDLVRFAKAIAATRPESFVNDLGPMLDIDRFVTYVAAEIATRHWDGFSGNNNNTYVYAHPKDGRFIFIPYGADQTLGVSRGRRGGSFMPGRSVLARKLLEVPALAERVRQEVARIGREPVWNVKTLLERLYQVGRILPTDVQGGRIRADVSRYLAYRSTMEAAIQAGGAQ